MVASASQPTTTVTMAAVFDLEAPEPEVFDLDDGWGDDLDFGDASGAEAASVPVKVAEGIGTEEALTRRRPSLRNNWRPAKLAAQHSRWR